MHKDDKKWVTEQLKKLPIKLPNPMIRQETLFKYNEAFKQAYESEPLQHRKEGKGRSFANNKLRVYVKTILERMK